MSTLITGTAIRSCFGRLDIQNLQRSIRQGFNMDGAAWIWARRGESGEGVQGGGEGVKRCKVVAVQIWKGCKVAVKG